MTFEPIHTARFLLRPLCPDDVSDAYSRWFDDPAVASHILAARSAHDVVSLRRYVMEKAGRDDVLFLGIFTKDQDVHIGNIKYEPIDERRRVAVMGILIGEPTWRGKRVAEEAIIASAKWLSEHRGILEIVLGVDKSHQSAITAYKKIGFQIEPVARVYFPDDACCMALRLD